MKISLTFDDTRVSAKFESSNPEARQLLAQHADSLRQVLESRGLSVEDLRVVAPDQSGPGAEPLTPRNAGQDTRPDPGAGAPFQHNAATSDGSSHGGQAHSQQSTGGAPWGSTRDQPDYSVGSPADGTDPEPPPWYAGTDAGALWLRLDTIA